MAFGHELDRLITKYLNRGGMSSGVVTEPDFEFMFGDRRTSEFQIIPVTGYRIWIRRDSGQVFAVLPTDAKRQEFLDRVEFRRVRNTRAAKWNRDKARQRRVAGSRSDKGLHDEQDNKQATRDSEEIEKHAPEPGAVSLRPAFTQGQNRSDEMSKTVVLKIEDREFFLKEHGDYWVASTSKESVSGHYVPNERVGHLLHALLAAKSLVQWRAELLDGLLAQVDTARKSLD